MKDFGMNLLKSFEIQQKRMKRKQSLWDWFFAFWHHDIWWINLFFARAPIYICFNIAYMYLFFFLFVFHIALSLNMPLVLNMPGFRIYQDYTGFRICPNNSRIYVNMTDYVWICLNKPEYAGICVDMSKSAWMAFVLHFHISLLVLQSFSFWARGNLYECLHEICGYSLKEKMKLLKRLNLIFLIVAGSISSVFCFKPNIFTNKI